MQRRLHDVLCAALLVLFSPLMMVYGAACSNSQVAYPSPAPEGGAIQSQVARMHLTQGALDAITRQAGALLIDNLADQPNVRVDGDRIYFQLDSSIFASNSTVADYVGLRRGSEVGMDTQALRDSLHVAWLPAAGPGQLPGARLTLDHLSLFGDLIMTFNPTGSLSVFVPPTACRLRGVGTDGARALQLRHASVDMHFGVRPKSAGMSSGTQLMATVDNVQVDLGASTDSAFVQIDAIPCDDTPRTSGSTNLGVRCSDPLCAGGTCADMCAVLGFLPQLSGWLQQAGRTVVASLVPQLTGALTDQLESALAGLPLTLETQLDVGDALSMIHSAPTPLSVHVSPAQDLGIRGQGIGTGLDLGINVGLATVTPHPACGVGNVLPNIPINNQLTNLQGPPPTYSGLINGSSSTPSAPGERYHAAISVSEAAIVQGAWNALMAGFLCGGIEADQVAELTGGAIALNGALLMTLAPDLARLTARDAAAHVTFRATRMPEIRFGDTLQSGQAITATTPLLQLALNALELDIYVWSDDTYLRVASLVANVEADLSIVPSAQHDLEVVLHGIRVSNATQGYNELIPAADLSGVLQTVAELVISNAFSNGTRWPLSLATRVQDSLNIPLQIRFNSVRHDRGPTGSNYLSIYASFCDPNSPLALQEPICSGVH